MNTIVYFLTSLLFAVGWTESRSITPLAVSLDGNDGIEPLEGLSELFADIIEYTPGPEQDKVTVKPTPKPTIDYSNRQPVVEEEIKKVNAYVVCGGNGLSCDHDRRGDQPESTASDSPTVENNDSEKGVTENVDSEKEITDKAEQVADDGSEKVTEKEAERVTEDGPEKVTEQGAEQVTDEGPEKVTEEGAEDEEKTATESNSGDILPTTEDEEADDNDDVDDEETTTKENIEEEEILTNLNDEAKQSETNNLGNNIISTPVEDAIQAITEKPVNDKEISPAKEEELENNKNSPPELKPEQSPINTETNNENSPSQKKPLSNNNSDRKGHHKDSDENDSDSDSDSDSSEEHKDKSDEDESD
ncbi:hypothetical protein O3M35_009811 [Rhynocoris fuscipes]|uniref:Uncharacterized protein n=1 Tax=Rhynocoris fuscipes TaxID=488301 RepID=A0AAW1D6Z9_9HEMI